MELKIKEAEKRVKTTNTYEIVVGFMEGDADGSEEHIIKFSEVLLENPEFMKELEAFLICINECIKQDSKGRGGFEDPCDLLQEYKDIKDWVKYCFSSADAIEDSDDIAEEEWLEEYGITKEEFNNPTGFTKMFLYDVPTYSEGWYDSYDSINIFYYDAFGDKFPVEVKF